ncbi:MAG: zinc ribbon domain-containing protein [Acidobacteria bacterium]|nr:zinc ribbon domain-containing protein [Acidobacteriota bacterium]
MNNFQCPRCKAAVVAGSRFCPSCGLAFSSPPPPPPPPQLQNKNKFPGWGIAGIALAAVVGSCTICGLIGAFTDKMKNSNSAQIENPRPGPTTAANVNATPTPPPTLADLKAQSEDLLKMEREEYSDEDIKRFDAVMQPLRAIPKDSKDYKEAQALNKKLIDKSSKIVAERLVLGPKPENSAYDGSVQPAENYLKQTLNDYSSSEYLGWTVVKKVYIGKEPYWGTSVKIRAKNGFGAYVINQIVFLIRNNQVVKASRV